MFTNSRRMAPRRPIPNSNVLDLRHVTAGTEPKARRRAWRLPRRPAPEAELHRPAVIRDWARVRREMIKFSIIGFIVLIPTVVIAGAARLSQDAQTVEQSVNEGLAAVRRGSQRLTAWEMETAATEFARAEAAFTQAGERLRQATTGLARGFRWVPIAGRKIDSAESAITAARYLAEAGYRTASMLENSERPDRALELQPGDVVRGSLGFLSPLLSHRDEFATVIESLSRASVAVAEIDARDVPTEYRTAISTWQRLHPVVVGTDGQRLRRLYDGLVGLFASPAPREYLVLFENHDELRPTGGFPGTFMLVKFDDGNFTVLDAPVRGPYDVAALIPKTTLPPQPLLAVAPYWTFQDAGWFFDLPTSSSFTLDFYEEGRGFRPDGILYITPAAVEDLLALTGPIRPPGYGLEITSENFVRATELQVEFGYDKELNNPKEFLLDFIPVFLDRLGRLPSDSALTAFVMFLKHTSEANILMYSEHQELQAIFGQLGWDGAIKDTDGDYLAVVNTNLGGGKTDRVMDERVKLEVEPRDGRLWHRLVIDRQHKGEPKDPLTSAPNKSFIRVYAPPQAELLSLTGNTIPPDTLYQPAQTGAVPSDDLRSIEGRVLVDEGDKSRITDESGRRTFGFWSIVNPGDTQSIVLEYSTALPSGKAWNLIWQKQPGAPQRKWEVRYQPGSSPKLKTAEPAHGRKSFSDHQVVWKTDSDVTRTFEVTHR